MERDYICSMIHFMKKMNKILFKKPQRIYHTLIQYLKPTMFEFAVFTNCKDYKICCYFGIPLSNPNLYPCIGLVFPFL